MIDKGLLKLFFASVLCLLSVSCIQDLGYDQEDFDPYSARRNPKKNLFGVYIENRKYIQAVQFLEFGSTDCFCNWIITTYDGEEVLLIWATIIPDNIETERPPHWECDDGLDVFITGDIWLCLPWGNIAKGKPISVNYPRIEIGIDKPFYIQYNENGEWSYINNRKTIPIESLTVMYSRITNDEIDLVFSGEVFLDCIKEPHYIRINDGIVHINRNDFSTVPQSIAYSSWLNYNRQYYVWKTIPFDEYNIRPVL